jgi:hypothetical protein
LLPVLCSEREGRSSFFNRAAGVKKVVHSGLRRIVSARWWHAIGEIAVSAPESGDKLTRFGPFSSQCRAGNVKIRHGAWNEELFRVLEGFPDLAHDDEVDTCSGALEMLNPRTKSWGLYELMRRQAQALKQQLEPQPPKTNWAPARSNIRPSRRREDQGPNRG